ncbi:MAG: hypothetical protein J6A01_01860 [Proteobacteria bacterium]|nr:hypothetical protein [Pseudomonadota bacterium]
MKNFSFLIALGMSLMIPAHAMAQKQDEESSFIMCTSMAGTEGEAQACTDWIREGTCLATYKSRISEVAKYISTANLQQYRIAAEKSLKSNCEAMTAVELNLDILENLSGDAERTARWERIVEWGNKLAPNQRRTVAYDLSCDNAFKTLLKRPKIKAFVDKSRDEAYTFLPEIDEKTTYFLNHLEEADPGAMSPLAQVVLLNYEIDHNQYPAAKDRISKVAFDKLPADAKKSTLNKIHGVTIPLFGDVKWASVTCFPEAKIQKTQTLKMFEMLEDSGTNSQVLMHIIAQKLSICDEDGAAKSLADDYAKHYANSEVSKLMENSLDYADKTRNDKWIRALVKYLSKVPNDAAQTFKTKHGAKLTQLALITARNDLANNRADQAEQLLEGLNILAPQTSQYEILLELGRAQSMTKKETQARQTWGMIIDKAGNGQLTEKAYYLTILSLQREKKTAEADQMKQQFFDLMPASAWHGLLNN